jgi:hypothetical protein
MVITTLWLESSLHQSQKQAIVELRSNAISLRPAALATLTQILRMSNLPADSLDLALSSISQHACVALHFHPDRPVGPRSVARGLLEDGIYRNQFETGISNGSVSAHPGGARDEWERSSSTAHTRPMTLNLNNDPSTAPGLSAEQR